MTESFEKLLAAVDGKIHVVNHSDDFDRFRSGLLYYWNKAEPLHNAAITVWPQFGLHEVAVMLTGMSMELLLKGIHIAFGKSVPSHHGLDELCTNVGIGLSDDDTIILKSISEYVTWVGRYPTPNSANQMFVASEIFDKQQRSGGSLANLHIEERSANFTNCERLWEMVASHYHRAREARIESVELRWSKYENQSPKS